MSLSASETKEAVSTLRDRLKHGQNMTKILESQLDTAQQNISLLQGQVRLANETILNLKKYFTETENTLNELLIPNHASSRVFRFDGEHKDHDSELSQKHGNVDSTTRSPLPTRSPIPTDTSSNGDNHTNKPQTDLDKREHHNKSPYAQQLRQVLDALQDEEPRKSLANHHHEMVSTPSSHKDCSCTDCQTPQHSSRVKQQYHEPEYISRRSSENSEFHQSKSKHKGHSNHHHEANSSPTSFHRGGHKDSMHGHSSYSSHCNGPCCMNEGSNYKMLDKSPHYHENDKSGHYLEKSSPNMHYVHSPGISEGSTKHGGGGDRHHMHHCNERPAHAGYMPGYVPYGYHMVENPHGIPHDAVQPMSPNARRKRPYIPLLPNEEPPHLKYTKVKRIDGSKLTAQKVLQDFTKRRFIAYNPRYDLDLLIVPPPIPAIDLLKGNNIHQSNRVQQPPIDRYPVSPSDHISKEKLYGESRQMNTSGSPNHDKSCETSPMDGAKERQIDDKSDGSDEHISDDHDTDMNDQNNNNNIKNNNNNNFQQSHNLYSPSKGVTVLPSIKEEPRSKLEDHINKLRNEQGANIKNSTYYKRGNRNSPGYTKNSNSDDNNNSNADSNTLGGLFSQEHRISNINNISVSERNNPLHEQPTR